MANKSYIDLLRETIGASEIVDLSHSYEVGMPVWPTHARYSRVEYENYAHGDTSLCYGVTLDEHSGTHIDAPVHFIPGSQTVDQIPPDTMMGRGVMINADFVPPCGEYTLQDLQRFEAEHGPIEAGDIIMLRFGWEDKYGINGGAVDFLKDWPGLCDDAAAYLADKGVKAVGCDALALDPFGSKEYPCHATLLGREIPILENLCNLKDLPTFSYVIGLWSKFKGGSASPLRLLALLNTPGGAEINAPGGAEINAPGGAEIDR